MDIPVISYASGHGGKHTGAAKGPQAIHQSLAKSNHHLPLKWQPELTDAATTQHLASIPIIAQLCQRSAMQCYEAVRNHTRFLVLGGDHSCAIGSWSGAAAALQEQGDLGLIWIDAHMDAHTPETTASHNVHGMPLAALLGFGNAELTEILTNKPKIKPANLVLIGVRSFEKDEQALLQELKVKIYYMEEINELGIDQVMQQAIEQVSKNTAGFGVSIDLDAIDPHEAPGVDCPANNGINTANFLDSLGLIRESEKFIGAEVAELNPELDKSDKTVDIAVRVIQELFS